MLTENSILALLLSPTCTFHTFLPFIFYFPLHRTSCTQPHFSTLNSTPTTFSRFSTFSFDARHISTKHEVSALSGFVLSQNRVFSHTLTLSRFRFRRAALFGTSGFSNSIFRLNICCSERMPALVINTLHRLRHTVLRIPASKRDQPVRHSTSHQKHTSEGHLLRKHRLISPCEVRKPDPVPIRLSSFKQTKVRRFQRLMLFTGTAIMIPVLVFAIALAHTVNSASARVHLFEKLGKSLENAPELYSL